MLTLLTARELTLDAAQSARSSRTSVRTLPPAQIKKLLDSRNDREVLDGLRKVISVRLLYPSWAYLSTLRTPPCGSGTLIAVSD